MNSDTTFENVYPFSEIVEINPPRTIKKGTIIKYVSMESVEPRRKHVSKIEYRKYNGGSKFMNNDILFARITPSLEHGKTCVVDFLEEGEVGAGSTEFIVISSRVGKTIPDYVYYLTTSNLVRELSIKSMTGTSGRQRVDSNVFDSIIVPVPPLNEQKAIAKILSDLDSKIELNQKMNKTLESIAQAIFKHWFIDFEFPNEEGKPYKSSGGEMIDSELGKIPMGWEVKKLKDVLREIVSGSRPKGGIDKTLSNGIPSIGAENINGLGYYDFSKTKYVTYEFFNTNKKGLVMDRDVLLYKDGAQLGRKTIFGGGFPFVTYMINEHVFILRVEKELSQGYLYFWLDRKDVTEAIKGLNTNSAQPGLNKEAVGSLRILVPPPQTLLQFDLFISFLLDRIFNNALNTKTISEIRDLLLPKLISGKIRVPLGE